MTELCEKLLRCLSDVDTISSSDLSVRLNCDAQKVVGAVKSLESLGGYINTELVSQKRWILTTEGREVMEGGSHEAIVFSKVPQEGIAQKLLMTNCGSIGKIGFSKAMSNGWIYIDKTGGGLVKRKMETIEDLVKQNLTALHQGQSIEETLKTEYKKRKLVEEVTEKIYILSKGPDFSTSIKKIPTDLTAEMIQSGSWKKTKFKSYNMNSLGVEPTSGFLHPLMKVRAEYRQIFLEMGFTEMPTNNYVESSFWNFDALFQPQQHPARDAHDTFFISEPSTTKHFPANYLERVKMVHSQGGYGSTGYGYDWKVEEAAKNLLRTHTTAVSARMLYGLANQKDGFQPQKYFSIDKVFRNETLDATHLAEFHQIEGVIADRGLTLGDLIGVLYQFFTKLGIEKLRFKPAYNPYTEPSMEIFSYHEGLGKWVEIGNSGVFRPEMLLPMGLPEDVNVIAWGLSLERPTMIKYGLNNIRDLVGHRVDLKMVRRNPLCRLDQSNDGVERQVNLLSKRFDKMLARLEILQERVKISAEASNVQLPSCVQAGSGSVTTSSSLVIQCPVSRPPLSLEYLLPLLAQHCPLYISTHQHSSVSASSPASLSLNTTKVSRTEAKLKMTIIYKDVEQTTLIITPGKQIQSEANLLRYLARSFPNSLYEDSSLVHKIDEVLDALAVADSKHAVTKLLAAYLENQPFLAGEKVSIADYLGLSVVRTYNISTPSVINWTKRATNVN